ncbi:MAG TPA: hypothetical protein VJ761_09425 [Ktedonobacteraceae bacterium]|nr:hypothetical protein [Ktedonobacteraceae bacterium]
MRGYLSGNGQVCPPRLRGGQHHRSDAMRMILSIRSARHQAPYVIPASRKSTRKATVKLSFTVSRRPNAAIT